MPNRSPLGFNSATPQARPQPTAGRDVFAGRPPARQPLGPRLAAKPSSVSQPQPVSTAQPVIISDFKMVAPQPFAVPAHPKLQQSKVLHRQAVRPPTSVSFPPQPSLSPKPMNTAEKIAKKPRPRRYLAGALTMAAIAILTVSFLLAPRHHRAAKTVASQTTVRDITPAPDSRPEEIKPTAASMGAYMVPADAPRQIIIPKLYAYSRVRAISLNSQSQSQLQAPGNIFDTGWYENSARPGIPGLTGGPSAVLIDGHTNGPTQPGVFANIDKLMAGDPLQIVRGDGKTFNYVVVKTQTLAALPASSSQFMNSAVVGKPGLNLMTVHGPYDKTSSSNPSTTVVFAVQSELTTKQ